MTSRTRRRWPWILVPLLVAGLLIVGIMTPEKPLLIRTLEPTRGIVEETVVASSVGTVEAVQTSVMTAEVSGRVLEIKIRQGKATRGAPVVILDRSDLEAEREQTVRDIATSKLRTEQAGLRVDKVDSELKRMKEPEDPIQRIEALQKDLAIAKKDVEIFTSAAQALEATLVVLDRRLAKTTLAAPYDGTVTKMHVEVGEVLTPGRIVFTIQGLPPFIVRAPIDEVDAGRIALGNDVRIRLDAFRDRNFAGKLIEIMPAASTDQKNNRTIDVKATSVELPDNAVAGMSGHVEIILRVKAGCLRVPTPHIREDHIAKTRYVFLAEGGVLKKRVIKTGAWNWDQTEILEGLSGGERLVIQSVDGADLKEGRRVVLE